jgi:hypothetical protein
MSAAGAIRGASSLSKDFTAVVLVGADAGAGKVPFALEVASRLQAKKVRATSKESKEIRIGWNYVMTGITPEVGMWLLVPDEALRRKPLRIHTSLHPAAAQKKSKISKV